MMKKRGLLLVALSLVIAAGAAWFANNYIQTRLAVAASGSSKTVTVMAAAMTLPYSTKIEARHLKSVQMPEEVVPPGSYRDVAELEGKVVKSEILDGEVILRNRIAGDGTGSALAALVEPNKRAVTVRVNDVIGVAGFLLPGNFVDVLGTRLEHGTTRRAQTETIIHMVKVLAVDQTAASDKNEPVVVRAVTLELTPQEAETLVKWEEEGTIQLALRNPSDTMVAENKPEPPKPKPAPVKRAPRPQPVDEGSTVTLIRGTKVQSTKTQG
jgi:pilus assembly protein CpaB